MHDAEQGTLAELRAERVRKAEKLRAAGQELYPARTERTHTIESVRTAFDTLETDATQLTIAGRIMSIRTHGAMAFVDLFDGTGALQGFMKTELLGDQFDLFIDTVDRGDIIECTGTAMRTKRGELSLAVSAWRMLAKSMLPMPTEHFGIKDEDERYRKRYLDMALDQSLRERLVRRSVFWNTARSFLLERGFIEVETPVLETMPGGAEAEPFMTHHNALDMDVYLRISAGELWQKKLMIGGIPRTFEIGRIFRNEGMSAEHAQDYTQLEFYQSYGNFEEGMEMIKALYQLLAEKTFGTTSFSVRGHSFDLAGTWERYDFSTLMMDAYGFDPRECTDEEVRAALEAAGLAREEALLNKERGVDTLWKRIRGTLSGPGFLVNVPAYLEPLAKRSDDDPRVVLRFQVVLAGSEVGKGFAELNDPSDQAERFAHQESLRAAGDAEAQFADTEFVEALEYGMPPTFGFGTSERLFSFLEGVSIREAQAFPLMRPKYS